MMLIIIRQISVFSQCVESSQVNIETGGSHPIPRVKHHFCLVLSWPPGNSLRCFRFDAISLSIELAFYPENRQMPVFQFYIVPRGIDDLDSFACFILVPKFPSLYISGGTLFEYGDKNSASAFLKPGMLFR